MINKRPFKQMEKGILPNELQIFTTKQKIYQYIKGHPGSLNKEISKAVGIIDCGEPLNSLEMLGIINHKIRRCCNAKEWYVNEKTTQTK